MSAAPQTASAIEPGWREGPYNYFVVDQSLPAVLEEFGRQMKLPVRVSADIRAHHLRGRLGAASPRAFLDWLCDSYSLVWYFDGVALHVLPQTAMRHEFLDLGPVPLADLKQRLTMAGIVEDRFPLQPTRDPALVSLAAPQLYISLVGRMLASMKAAAEQPRSKLEAASSQRNDASPPPAPVAAAEAPAAAEIQPPAMSPSPGAKNWDRLSAAERLLQEQKAEERAPLERRRVMVFRGAR